MSKAKGSLRNMFVEPPSEDYFTASVLDFTLTGTINVNLCNRICFLLSLIWSILSMVIALPELTELNHITSKIVSSGWNYQYQLEVVLSLMIFNYTKRKQAERILQKFLRSTKKW